MTYALSIHLQSAIFTALQADASLTALIDDRVYDAPPHGDAPSAAPGPYVLIGDEEVDAFDAGSLSGSDHTLSVVVISPQSGFAEAKSIGAAVSDVLTGAPLTLTRGVVVQRRFISAATTRIENDGGRRIDLNFRFLVQDD